MLPSLIVMLAILVAIASSLIFKENVKTSSFQFLVVYLCTNFLFEALVLILNIKLQSNVWIYNLEMIFEVTFYLLLYKNEYVDKAQRIWIALGIAAFLFFSVVNLILLQRLDVFNSNTYTFGSFLLTFTCCYFLYDKIIKNESQNPLSYLMFWISMGVLFCYLGNFPFLSNVNQLFEANEEMSLNLRLIGISVNVLLYILIAVGFICNRKT